MHHRISPLRALARSACLAVLALAAPLLAHAGAGTLDTQVSALSNVVTYSTAGTRPLTTFVGYEVRIANLGGNTINNIRFTANATDADPTQKATFSSAEGATCTATNADQTAIECSLGQLKAGEVAAPFRVFFVAPVKAAANTLGNGVIDPLTGTCTGDCLVLSGITYYAEGTGGPNSVPQNSTDIWPAVTVALGTANPTRVKSAVPRNGGEFFTGSGGQPTDTDRFASTVKVPPATSSTTAEIQETSFSLTEGCTNFLVCWQSSLTVPPPAGSTSFSPNYLTITLRIDAANIPSGTKINTIVPTYNGEPVGLCANATTPRTDGKPCIASRREYGKGNNVPADLRGDFEWVFINIVNGTYRLP